MRDDARDPWQKPRRVVDALELSGDETIIDVGSGAGYFARHLASRAQRVIAVEPVKAWWPLLGRFDPVASIFDLIGPVDLIFAANVLRFLGADERAQIGELARRVVLIDWKRGARPVGPPEAEAISTAAVLSAFPDFVPGPAHDFLPYQWMIELNRA
jgi:hypothetical protein